jgi:hypothetical protein
MQVKNLSNLVKYQEDAVVSNEIIKKMQEQSLYLLLIKVKD